ncbi:hypothetical protein G6W51_17255 [Streptomyces coelicolor]|nr:hypothetical protein [Streptomyces coelicolor]
MDLTPFRSRIHAMFTLDEDAEQELDRRLDDLIAAAQQDEGTTVIKVLPPRDATCAGCGHSGADHHHGDTKCWAHLPRTRQRNGAWSAITICDCSGFQAA